MKKFLYIALALIMTFTISTNAFAADTTTTTKTNDIKLTIDDTMKMVETNNKEIKALDMQVAVLYNQYKDAESKAVQAESALQTPGLDSSTIINLRAQQILTPKQKYFAVANAIHDRDERLIAIKQDVKKQYLQAFLFQDNISNFKNEIAIAYKKIDEIGIRQKLGQFKLSEIKAYQDRLSALNMQLMTYNNQYSTAVLLIKNAVDLKSTDNITLISSNFKYIKFDDEDIENRITKAVEKSYEVEKQNQNMAVSQIQYELYGAIDAKYMTSSNQYSLDTTKLTVQSNLWSAYYNLKNLENSVESENKNQINELDNLNLIILKNNLKLNTSLDLLNEQLAYSKQLAKTKSAVNDYVLYVDTFKNMLGEK